MYPFNIYNGFEEKAHGRSRGGRSHLHAGDDAWHVGTALAMNIKLEKIDSIENEVRSLRVLLNDLTNENKLLKTEIKQLDQQLAEMNDKNNSLENRLNSLEQHHRGWSARVLGIPLSPEEESDNYAVAAKVYDLALLPILRGTVERKMLRDIPSADQLLEIAHVLPGKAGDPKPVIVRFYNRNVRDTIFKLKKFYCSNAKNYENTFVNNLFYHTCTRHQRCIFKVVVVR